MLLYLDRGIPVYADNSGGTLSAVSHKSSRFLLVSIRTSPCSIMQGLLRTKRAYFKAGLPGEKLVISDVGTMQLVRSSGEEPDY